MELEATMKAIHYLAADLFGYSYKHYQEKVSMNHIRFTKYMPDAIRTLRKGIHQGWTNQKIATAMDMPIEKVDDWKAMYELYADLHDDDHLGRFFVESVKADIEKLQIKISASDQNKLIHALAYRLMDLDFKLEANDECLKDYGDYFRFEIEDDHE
jgi:hypothetical protein